MSIRPIILLIIAGLYPGATLIPGEYHVDKSRENVVKFVSDAPFENFEGVTGDIDGYLYWEVADPTSNSAVYFEVDLNTLDTGIGLRNRHMRENYLETDRYPRTSFKGQITRVAKGAGDTLHVGATGTIFIHGIERSREVDAKLIATGQGFRIVSRFIVKLSDFDIEIPSIMFYKINENMDLQLDFYVKKIAGTEQ